MRTFLVLGHRCVTHPFKLNDLPGAGRMDILCRCVNSALFLSHDLRRNVEIYLLLQGTTCIRISGEKVRYLNPDERSAGSLISKALEKISTQPPSNNNWTPSTPGISVARTDMEKLLNNLKGEFYYLKEGGEDIRNVEFTESPIFILGDHLGVMPEEEKLILERGARTISIGPKSLHADHCIILIHNELDRREKQTL